jgi:hypothetical protein
MLLGPLLPAQTYDFASKHASQLGVGVEVLGLEGIQLYRAEEFHEEVSSSSEGGKMQHNDTRRQRDAPL